jgi:carboxyl-terminal processing protease
MKALTSKILLVGSLFLALTACKRNEDVRALDTDVAINEWILEQMKTWYYWNNKLPANASTNTTPDKFFDAILYKYDATMRPDGDRFSWIQANADQLQASLAGESKTTGAEIRGYRSSTDNAQIGGGRILYVLPNSPAARAGLKRGDVFSKLVIDGQTLNVANYGALLSEGTNYVFTMGKYENGNFVSTNETKTAAAQAIQEDPLHLDTVYVKNDKRIGYLVYNQFVATPNGSNTPVFNNKMDAIFAKFKAANINELVLDLRYNRGGTSTASKNLGSLIAKGVTSKNVFVRREWNATVTPELRKQYGEDFFYDYFTEKTQNVGNNLQRVYILTSSQSASASELIINGLKPYMNVFLIGDVTTGKNTGSITLRDDKKRHNWGLQPIVAKNFNSDGKSDFTAGFRPNVSVIETLSNPIYAFGDLRDPLLQEAYFQITGGRTVRRAATEPTEADQREVFSTIDKKAGGGSYFIDLPERIK